VPASLRRRIGGNPVESVEDDEVYVVLDGSGVLEVAGESLVLSEGHSIFVLAGAEHRFTAYEQLAVLAVFARR
jgi:mannose-6-phosphate isomerase-like protein (cupin superfamily)